MTDYLGVDVPNPTCSVAGCDRTPVARGWCSKHYQRWAKFGDPLADHSRKRGICTIDDCDATTEAKGLCHKHYQRLRNFGDPMLDRRKPRVPCSVDGCDRKPVARELCAGHYTRWKNGRSDDPSGLRRYIRTDDVADRFRRVAPTGDATACWEWQGTRRKGYGVVSVGESRNRDAHLVAWELHHGRPIPPGMVIRHSCDNPPCVNPSHLLLGTHADNVNDMVGRNRQSKGSGHGLAKLNEKSVLEIREMNRAGWTQKSIAERFGISQSNVSIIVRGKGWRHT